MGASDKRASSVSAAVAGFLHRLDAVKEWHFRSLLCKASPTQRIRCSDAVQLQVPGLGRRATESVRLL